MFGNGPRLDGEGVEWACDVDETVVDVIDGDWLQLMNVWVVAGYVLDMWVWNIVHSYYL